MWKSIDQDANLLSDARFIAGNWKFLLAGLEFFIGSEELPLRGETEPSAVR
jgi:hypothetical protein